MKFTLSWLKKHLDTDASLDEITDAMVRIGLEVEEVENPAARLSAITLGRVVSAEKHPDADKLKVCQVETKEGPLQIVCGAPNARAGINVAFAPVGTYIPGIDVTLSKAKIRGVESYGMMCSARELELGEDHDGIMELPDGEVGAPLADILGLDDPIIDFEVTPNRPDTNGVDGIARDLAAAGLGTLVSASAPSHEGAFEHPVAVKIDDPAACPAFASRVIRGVRNGPSPKWLQDQLRAVGLRPINALVDVTNYLSYDRARPLHVYDVAKLSGTVCARMGQSGESFLALDGKSYTVDDSMCVIADDAQVLGLGGVMGGETSGCTAETTDVLIESALFEPLMIARTGRKTGIVSDARYRFERGVDPASVLPGLELATALILEICGGEASACAVAGEVPHQRKVLSFPPSEVQRLTGIDCADSEKERILTALGFEVTRGGVWEVTVPTARPDIEGKADLVEEIARIHGLDHLPTSTLPRMDGEARPAPAPASVRAASIRDAMVGAGYLEAVTWAFCDARRAVAFGGGEGLTLENPISSDLSVMRPSALPNLVDAAARNHARGIKSVKLFEIGGQYRDDTPTGQRTVLAAIASGVVPSTWRENEQAPDVFAAKQLALTALEALGAPTSNLTTFATGPEHYHPGRVGTLGLGPKKPLAFFGELHPALAALLDLDGPVAAIEVMVDDVPLPRSKGGKAKKALAKAALTPITRDFAFVVSEDASAEALLKAVKGADKTMLSDVRLFDVYRGAGIADGEKSLAVEITLQPTVTTPTDEEIDAIAAKVIAQAEKAVGARLRG